MRLASITAISAVALAAGIAVAEDDMPFPWLEPAQRAAAAAAARDSEVEPAKVDVDQEGATPVPVQDGSAAQSTPAPQPTKATPADKPDLMVTRSISGEIEKQEPDPPAEVAGSGKGQGTRAPPPVAAKKLFGAVKTPAPLSARAIGAYSRGCLAGAKPLAVDGPTWQAMRLSRNRNWGHPKLIKLLERFATEVKKEDGWPGLLIGDISQPRGGPMLTGHASHQIGLDADIWFTPMPDRRLSNKEREELAATSMLSADSLSVNPKVWDDRRVRIIKRVASYPSIERVLVHPAIKKALCEATPKEAPDRAWLNKVRPYWGHFYHFHIRIGCPDGSAGCKPQAPIPGNDGCNKELDHWFKLMTAPPAPKPTVPVKPTKPKPPLTLADLPSECGQVLQAAGGPKIPDAAKPDPAAKKPGADNAKQPANSKSAANAKK